MLEQRPDVAARMAAARLQSDQKHLSWLEDREEFEYITAIRRGSFDAISELDRTKAQGILIQYWSVGGIWLLQFPEQADPEPVTPSGLPKRLHDLRYVTAPMEKKGRAIAPLPKPYNHAGGNGEINPLEVKDAAWISWCLTQADPIRKYQKR